MAMVPMRRNPLTSMLDFAAERNREAASLGSVISQIAQPALKGMGVQTDEMTPQPAVMRGPVPTAQPLGAFTGPAVAPTLVDARETPGLQPRVTELLTGLESAYGQPLNVTSGYRSPEHNAAVGGAKGSQHMHGNAVDIDVSGMSTDERRTLIELAKAQGFTGVGIYDNSLHFDTGAERAWGPSYRRDSVPSWAADLVGGAGSASMNGNAGTDTLGTGNNVEDILAQLYPQMSPEDEKKQNRKDFFAAASQGLSALSQGRPQDFSNIRQAKEQRRTQAVQDMRERERARAAATLVLDQGGSPAMATALATGAASMGDFMTDRQIRKAQETADKQKLLAAQRAKLLVPSLEAAGIPEARIAEIVAYGEEGGDVTELLTLEQTAAAANKAREAEAAQEELAQLYANSDDPAMRRVGNLMLSGGLGIKEAVEVETTLNPAAGGNKEFAAIAEARAIVASGAKNPDTGKPFASEGEVLAWKMLNGGSNAGPQSMVTVNPDGTVTVQPPTSATAAPAGVGAPAVGAPAVGAFAAGDAPAGVAGAFNQQFGGMETGIPAGAAAPVVAAQTLPLPVATEVANLEKTVAQTADIGAQTQVRLQELSQAIAEAPDQLTKLGLENEELQLRITEAQARTDVAPEVQAATLANLQADLEKKQTELATLEADAAKQQTAEYANASRSFAVFENAAKSALTKVDNAWTTGTYGKIAMSFLPDNFATARSSFIEDLRQMGSQAMLNALAEAKAAGVTLTPVSNLDVGALGASQSKLSNPERLEGEDIRKEVVFQLNFAKDAIVGPKDLNRVDEFGQTYKTTQDTLGLTEDTFARHWREIPPAVAEAWRNGELDALPTDDPLYAEAADVLNQQINNWQTYQGDLDRATVGVLPTPPEGIDAAEWPDVWLELSIGERAAYRKQTKKGNQ